MKYLKTSFSTSFIEPLIEPYYQLIAIIMIAFPALSIYVGGAVVEKTVTALAIPLFFLNYNRIAQRIASVDIVFFVIMVLLGLISYLKNQVTGLVYTPIFIIVFFLLGQVSPFKKSTFVFVVANLFSWYVAYHYYSSFQIELKSGRFNAEGFDINYIAFIGNYLSVIAAFYLRQSSNKLSKIIIASFLLMNVLMTILTFSRGGILGISFVVLLLVYRTKTKFKTIVVLTVVMFVLSLQLFLHDEITFFIDRFFNPSQRDTLAATAKELYLKADLSTQMLGGLEERFVNIGGLVTHNDPLRILLRYGLLFLIVYHIYMFYVVCLATYKAKLSTGTLLPLFTVAIIGLYVFRGNFSNFFPMLSIYYFIGSFHFYEKQVKDEIPV